MSVKREELKVGNKYSLGDVDNVLEILASHNTFHWIEWVDNGELESVYFERHDLKAMMPVNQHT